MLRSRAKLVALFIYSCDVILIVTAFFLAYGLRYTFQSTYAWQDYLGLLLIIIPLWSALLYYFGLYESYRTKPTWSEPLALLKVAISATLLVGTTVFVLKLHSISRSFTIFFGIIAFFLLASNRLIIRIFARTVRKEGGNYRNFIIVGTGSRARKIAKIIEENKHWGLKLLGIVTDNSRGTVPQVGHYPVLGHIDKISTFLQTQVVDEVIFAVSRKQLETLERTFLMCEELGIRTRVAVNFFPHMIAKVHLDDMHGIPLLTFTTTPDNEFLLAVKRVFDLVLSSSLLVFSLPLFLIVSVAIKISSSGPIFFKQIRVGLNGRRFLLYKFRSMVHGAELKRDQLTHLNEMNGPVFKIKNDPRLTQIGKFLRKLSFDELPQLMNVLKGDMSLVGPRPPLPEEVAQYKPWQRRRLSMKPGITCLWQINGRNQVRDFDQWMKLDLEYIDHWSLRLDFKIFFKTIPVVLLGRGAS